MHELAIAASILETVQGEAERLPGTKVGVRVGELSGWTSTPCGFGFECLVKDTDWEHLGLAVEYIPRVQRFPKCSYEFGIADFDPRCPLCGELLTQCISGEELDIAYMEGDE